MAGLLKPAAPRTVNAGPLGNLEINEAFSGFGLWQGYPSAGDQNKKLFMRGEAAVAHATDILSGRAFGAMGAVPTQWRGALEAGLIF